MTELHDHLWAEMRLAQARHEESANKSGIPAPLFRVGDSVRLSARNIKTARTSKKLDHKRIGKFTITKVLSSHANQLDLPAFMKIHPLFHESLLEPASDDPHLAYRDPPSLPDRSGRIGGMGSRRNTRLPHLLSPPPIPRQIVGMGSLDLATRSRAREHRRRR